MEKFRLTPAGADTAILTYECFERITYQGSEVTGTFHVAATYLEQDGRWRLLLWQITPYDGA